MSRDRDRSCSDSGVLERVRGVPRVLIVEDDRDASDLLVMCLEAEGFAVATALTVREALAALERDAFDVVAIDLWLESRLDGLQLAHRLRDDRATRRLGLVAMSGFVEPEWAVVQPFDAYLRKPVDVDLLADLIERLADLARAPRSFPTAAGGR